MAKQAFKAHSAGPALAKPLLKQPPRPNCNLRELHNRFQLEPGRVFDKRSVKGKQARCIGAESQRRGFTAPYQSGLANFLRRLNASAASPRPSKAREAGSGTVVLGVLLNGRAT